MPYLHVLSDTSRIVWIKEINSIRLKYENVSNIESITVLLPENIRRTELHPMHIVSLACLLEFLNSKCKSLKVLVQNNDTLNFLSNDLKLGAYFAGLPHTDAASSNLFNLWKIIPEQAPSYSHGLSSYFKQNLFKGLDISFFNIAIDELYGNIADHSNANGVAYSYIEYDQISKTLKVSFCDFGIGIPTSIKSASIPNPNNLGYIALATRKGITTKSNFHNFGFGLDTVVSCTSESDFLRIISNDEVYYCFNSRKIEKTYKLDFDFHGTLIYFDLKMDNLEIDETLESSSLFD